MNTEIILLYKALFICPYMKPLRIKIFLVFWLIKYCILFYIKNWNFITLFWLCWKLLHNPLVNDFLPNAWLIKIWFKPKQSVNVSFAELYSCMYQPMANYPLDKTFLQRCHKSVIFCLYQKRQLDFFFFFKSIARNNYGCFWHPDVIAIWNGMIYNHSKKVSLFSEACNACEKC